MSSSKAALKSAKAAIDAHKYDEAAREAQKVLSNDPTSYHASVWIFYCHRFSLILCFQQCFPRTFAGKAGKER